MKQFKAVSLVIIAAALVLLGFLVFSSPLTVQAQGAQPTPTKASGMVPSSSHNGGDCMVCHSNQNLVGKFPNGETVSLYYDAELHQNSVHAERGVGCTACHEAEKNFPHSGVSDLTICATCHLSQQSNSSDPLVFQVPYRDIRELGLKVNESCQKCHQQKADEVKDSAHARIMQEGNRFAPVCVDCHGSHDITPPGQPRSKIPLTCSKCHLAVYTTYASSVHGSALEVDGNEDVPTCGDCHGIHVVRGPQESDFRANSIELCGKCHTNKDMMSKYGISTDVMRTYLDDFHGRTVDFSRLSGDNQITKATCYDCHGVHNIRNPKDPSSTVYPTNLQTTCQHCHPDANITFPQAWLSHSTPTLDSNPALYTVNTVYQIVIPLLIGGFMVYILLDARRRIAEWMKARSK